MARALSRVWGLLRSRRVAVALIVSVASYVFVGTLIPQPSLGEAEWAKWETAHPTLARVVVSAGMRDPYATPVFFGLVGLLTLSTAVCAVERTRNAARTYRRADAASASQLQRLRQQPAIAVPLVPVVPADEALERVAAEFARDRLRVQVREGLVEAHGGRLGVVGSPVFHWSLVAIAIVLAAGVATRSEGALDLPLGVPVIEKHDAYYHLEEGPLFGERHTGLTLVASDLVYNLVADGVGVGPAPVVTLLDSGSAVASQRVYPNNPLRYGPLLLHLKEYGLAADLVAVGPKGEATAAERILFQFSRDTTSGTLAQELGLSQAGASSPLAVRVEVPVDRDASGAVLGRVPRDPRLLVAVGDPATGSWEPTVSLALGQAVPLPGGSSLRFGGIDNWVRVTVANDWSVPWLYALFGLACLSLGVALFVPPRGARVLLVSSDGAAALHVAVWHSRRDTAFTDAVHAAVAGAASGTNMDKGPDSGRERGA